MMKTNWVQKNIGKRIWGQKILKWEEKKICQKILQKNCLSKKIVSEKIFDQKIQSKKIWDQKDSGPEKWGAQKYQYRKM